MLGWRCSLFPQRRLDQPVADSERVGVEHLEPARRAGGLLRLRLLLLQRALLPRLLELRLLVRVLGREEHVVHADLGGRGGGGAHPVQMAFGLASLLEIDARCQPDHRPRLVADDFSACDVDARPQEAHFLVGREAVVLGVIHFPEVVALDVDGRGEQHLPRAEGLVLGVVGDGELLPLLREPLEGDLQRAEDRKAARRRRVELLAGDALQQLDPRRHLRFGHADLLAELVDHGRGVASALEALERHHARVVPARDVPALDEVLELALGHDAVSDVEAGVLPRRRLVEVELVQQPVVRPVDRLALPKLEGAQRVCDVLERVDDAVGEVIRRVDAPCVPCPRVRVEEHAVRRRVPQRRVVREQVSLHPKHGLALVEPALAHLLEQGQVLLHRPVAVRARRAFGKGLARGLAGEVLAQLHPLRLDLLACLVAHVRAA
mmetsp:Transcript_21006/g.50394  ORF Transcript_21006/g.50394 Transcript_21006/m.50394 type:complete len:435 (+) Transcript_21006:558-1862(+)